MTANRTCKRMLSRMFQRRDMNKIRTAFSRWLSGQRNITFGWDHYTYINQIFGADPVRKILEEVYPNCEYRLAKEPDINFGDHHFVENIKTGEKIDSMRSRLQHSRIDINDTLCQSYSAYFYINSNIPLTKDKKQKQLDMINMYRKLLRNKVFVEQINQQILLDEAYRGVWQIYKRPNRTEGNINMNKASLIKKINGVLDDWEEFGYSYFIGSGQ